MATEPRHVLIVALLLGTCGCFSPRGYILTHTTVPYFLPYETAGRVSSKSCRVDITQVKEPFSRANLSVMWTNRAVSESMKRAGMTELRYADLQTLSVMNSVYERRRLIFYGE